MASLLHLADFPESSLGALVPYMIPERQKHRPVHWLLRGTQAGGAGECAYLSLFPLKAEFFRLLHQFVCKASMHPLTESSLQLRPGGASAFQEPPSLPGSLRETVRPAMPRPAKGRARSWG